MKKVFIIIFSIGIIAVVTGFHIYRERILYREPYIGRYDLLGGNSALVLKMDSNCTIINNSYKIAFCEFGNYKISGDNIEIKIYKNENGIKENKFLKGRLELNKIKVYNSSENKNYVYLKE